MRAAILFIGLSILCSIQMFGQEQNAQNHATQTDTLKTRKVSTLIVPIVFYSPETNFAFGGGAQMYFNTGKSNSETLNSSVLFSGIYTLNQQLMIEIQPQIYFNYENYFLDSKFRYKIFPNLFWGIGQSTPDSAQENYNQTEITFSTALIKKLTNTVNFGFEFTYSNFSITEVDEGGLLESEAVEGSNGATLIGLGIVLNQDSRDNRFSPLYGSFFQFKTNFTTKVLGSTHNYNTYFIDMRKYFNLGGNHILALQLYSRLSFGTIPFQGQSYYGGADVARGYFRGRFIDDHLYVVQIEYRLPLGRRWEMAAFALTGNVGNNQPGSGLFNGMKPSYGFGPRFFIYKHKRTLLRLDIGFNDRGESGIYFGVNEAF